MEKKRLEQIKEHFSYCIDTGLTIGEQEEKLLNELYEQAENLEKLKEVIARNLTAWDTSKDSKQGLLPEVYWSNRVWYKRLTGEDYFFSKAVKKFNIE